MNQKKMKAAAVSATLAFALLATPAWAAPSEILAHGSVSVFDYYLDNYDENGNVRITPQKTTFDLSGQQTETDEALPAFYSPDAELTTDSSGFDAGAEVLIKFALNNDSQQQWYDGITKVMLMSENGNAALEQQLIYEKAFNSYTQKTDCLTLPAGQNELSRNGRFTVKIYSQNGAALKVPIHIVNQETPQMNLSYPTNPKVGEDIRFELIDFDYAITNPITRVTLEYPTADGGTDVKTLQNIADYGLIGDVLRIWNENSETKEENFSQSGRYTVTVYADGFKTFSKTFSVQEADSSVTKAAANISQVELNSLNLDGRSSATSGGSTDTDGDGTSDSAMMNADLIFNHDLLSNALLLHEIGRGNEESEAIRDRWELEITRADAVMNEDGSGMFDFIDYLNAVQDAKLEQGEYLTFDEYSQTGLAELNRPYQVKYVLEDNKLGAAQSFGDTQGQPAPTLTVLTAQEGTDIVIQGDAKYLNAVTDIVINKNWSAIDEEQYTIADDQLTISKDVYNWKLGETNTIEIQAKGYQKATLYVVLEKQLDTVKLELVVKEDGSAYQAGDVVTLQGLTADFLQYLQSVTVNGRNVLTQEAGGSSGNDWYTPTETGLTLQGGLFPSAGDYTITVTAEHYGSQSITVTIAEKTTGPVDPEQPGELLTAPTPQKYGKDVLGRYALEFGVENKGFFGQITAVSVGNQPLKESDTDWNMEEGTFYSSEFGTAILFGSDILKEGETVTVTIQAAGYEDLTVVLDENGNIQDDQPTTPEVPGELLTAPTPQKYGTDIFGNYKLEFGYNDMDYFGNEDMKVLVDGTPLDKSTSSYPLDSNTWYTSQSGSSIDFGSNILKENANVTVTIQATGYEDLVIILDPSGEIVTEESTELAAAKVKQDDISVGETTGEPEQDDTSVGEATGEPEQDDTSVGEATGEPEQDDTSVDQTVE